MLPLGPEVPRSDFNLYVSSSTFVVLIYYFFKIFDLALKSNYEKAHFTAQADFNRTAFHPSPNCWDYRDMLANHG